MSLAYSDGRRRIFGKHRIQVGYRSILVQETFDRAIIVKPIVWRIVFASIECVRTTRRKGTARNRDIPLVSR